MRRYSATIVLLKSIAVSLLVFFQQTHAATQPVSEQLGQAGIAIYTNLAQGNHVFGYQFRVLEDGQIDRVGGYFAGNKTVVIVNDGNEVVASAPVSGNASEFSWSPLSSSLPVETGQLYQVLVRMGTDQTSSAAWDMPMPFSRGGIEVLSLLQGWSSNSDPQVWIESAQSLPEQHARGIVDIGFVANNTPVQPPVEDTPNPVQRPSAGDPFPSTVGVIDSFGQAAPSGPMGMGFMAVRAYYRDFPRKIGECSLAIHDRYWVRDAHGVTHPTWHPPIDAATGCHFGHEHGDDPRESPNYVFAEGVPFGITHGDSNGLMRHEDHVGHKVVVQSDWGLVDGNPQNGQQPQSDGVIRLPAGGFIQFSPYYVVLNPARYLDHRWAVLGAADGYVSTLDLCFDDNAAFRGRAMGFCESVPVELGQLDSGSRQRDIRNPMNGTRRVIHPKSIVVYSKNESGSDDVIRFCTNRLGRDARIPERGYCAVDEIEQLVSRSDRRQWGWSGSDVNAITVGGQLRGAGYLNEWVRDFDAPGIRFPN